MWQNLSFLSVDGSFFPFHDWDILLSKIKVLSFYFPFKWEWIHIHFKNSSGFRFLEKRREETHGLSKPSFQISFLTWSASISLPIDLQLQPTWITPPWVKHAHIYVCFSCHTVPFAFTALSPLSLQETSFTKPSFTKAFLAMVPRSSSFLHLIPFPLEIACALPCAIPSVTLLSWPVLTFFIIYPFALCIFIPNTRSALVFVDLICIKR